MSIEQQLAALTARIDALERENAALKGGVVAQPEPEPAGLTPMERVKIKELARDTHRLMALHGRKGYDMAMALHGRPVAKRGRMH